MSKIIVAKILTSHGIKGYVKLESYAEHPKDVFNYQLFDANNKEYKTKFVGTLKENVFIAAIEGITNPEVAKEYRNTELFMEADDDEIFLTELLGIEVRVLNDAFAIKQLGKIVSVDDYGAGTIIEIEWEGEKQSESIPFTEDYFKEITKEYLVVERPQYI
jgi:16S rRNA processing protein RimM